MLIPKLCAYSQNISKEKEYLRITRDGVLLSEAQVNEIAKVIKTNDLLGEEISLYKRLVNQQDTLNFYSETQISKLDSLVLGIDKNFSFIFREYNKLSTDYLRLEDRNRQLTKSNDKLSLDNKKLRKKVWLYRILSVIGVTTVIILN